MLKVIKAYTRITSEARSPEEIAFADDRAMADFRGFYAVADVHAARVRDPRALDALLEITDNIKSSLLERRKVIT